MRNSSDSLHFWMSRVKPMLGLILAALFIVLHVVPLSAALGGDADYNLISGLVTALPLYDLADAVLAIFLIAQAFFAILSLYSSSFNLFAFFSAGNLSYILRRISAIAVVPFAAYFIYVTRFSPSYADGGFADFTSMARLFHSKSTVLYFVGGFTMLAVFMATSLRLVCFQWGILASRKSRSTFEIFIWGAAALFVMWGILVLFAFR